MRLAGDIYHWERNRNKIWLAKRTYYTPDFLFLQAGSDDADRPVFVEVKGWWREDARVKFKVAREKISNWAILIAVTKEGGRWVEIQ